MSSVYPRNSTMAAWVWALTKPGITARPRPSMHLVGRPPTGRCAPAPTSAMRPSSTSRSPGPVLAGVDDAGVAHEQGAHAASLRSTRASTSRQALALRLALAWMSA